MIINRKTSVSVGIVLILVGLAFVASHFFQFEIHPGWPFIIIGAGAVLLILGILVGAPEMAIPAAIVSGIGGILYYQAVSGHWESWAFLWTLIPGFVGIGMFLAWLLSGLKRFSPHEFLDPIISSLVMFAIFFAIFGSIFGYFEGGLLQSYWPLVLVAAGVLILVRGFFNLKRKDSK